MLQGAWDLVTRIYDDFMFDPTATDISTPVTQVLRKRRGVCQDFSHLALACLRSLRPAGALCQRLYPDEPAARAAAACRRGRFARVDFGVGAGSQAGSTSIRPTG